MGKEQSNPHTQKISCKLGRILIAVVPGETLQIHDDDILHFPETPEL